MRWWEDGGAIMGWEGGGGDRGAELGSNGVEGSEEGRGEVES